MICFPWCQVWQGGQTGSKHQLQHHHNKPFPMGVKDWSLSSGVVWKDTLVRYPEVLNRVWLQLMCCAVRFAYGISPKACAQRSLCRRFIAQSFEATAKLGLWQKVNLTNNKECDVWCDCHVWLWPWSWLDFLNLTWHVLSSRLSRTSLDLYLNLGWTYCYCYR